MSTVHNNLNNRTANDPSSPVIPMRLRQSSWPHRSIIGIQAQTLPLTPGRYEYKFVVDDSGVASLAARQQIFRARIVS